MDVHYVLYSKDLNVAYYNDIGHDRFWSFYLRSQHPKASWLRTRTDIVSFLDVMLSMRESKCKRYDLYNHQDKDAQKILKQIGDARNDLAIERLENYTFLAYKSVRGEAVIKYLGQDVHKAIKVYSDTPGIEGLEVHKNGVYVDTITSLTEFLALRAKIDESIRAKVV